MLVICGDKDSDNGSAAELAKLLPAAKLAIVPGDHNHASATAEFSNAVKQFLKAHGYWSSCGIEHIRQLNLTMSLIQAN